MTAVLSFDLKKGLHHLTVDDRWSVLTVFILHANARNRCYPTMETVAQMGANGNLKRATAAKRWLIEVGALILVPYNKRVGDEQKLPRRQHVYQLTGKFIADGQSFNYLYLNPEIIDGENFTIENFNGDNRSIPIVSKPIKESVRVANDDLPAAEIIPPVASIETRKPKVKKSPVIQAYKQIGPDLSPEEAAALSKAAIAEHVAKEQARIERNTNLDQMVKLVTDVTKQGGWHALQLARMLMDIPTNHRKNADNEYSLNRIPGGITPEEFLTWTRYYQKHQRVVKDGTDVNLKTAKTLSTYITGWIAAGKPDPTKPTAAQTAGAYAHQSDWTPDPDAGYADRYFTDDGAYLGSKREGYEQYQAYRQQQKQKTSTLPPVSTSGAAYSGAQL